MEHIIDGKGQPLGRLATKIASILQGKTSAHYEARKIGDNKVVVKNANLIKVSGNKYRDKIYHRHTGYMGHLKERRYHEIFAGNPEWIIKHAVAGMLPKNSLRPKRLKLLKIEK